MNWMAKAVVTYKISSLQLSFIVLSFGNGRNPKAFSTMQIGRAAQWLKFSQPLKLVSQTMTLSLRADFIYTKI